MVREVREIIDKSGLAYEDFSKNRSFFDFLVTNGEILVIKVLGNAAGLKEEHAGELRRMASFLGGRALVIADRMGNKVLDRGVVYWRYGAPVVSPATLEDILSGEWPVESEYKGRRTVALDPERLKEKRKALGYSLSSLAREINVSKETLYRYERGCPADKEIAMRLVEVLGSDILGRRDILFQETPSVRSEILLALRRKGMEVVEFSRAPIEGLGKYRKEFSIGIARKPYPAKVSALVRISLLLDAVPLLIVEKGRADIPTLKVNEIKEMSLEELEEITR